MAIKISGNTIINDSRVVENADRIGIGTTNPYVALEISSGDVGIGTTNPTASNIKTSLQNNTNVLAVGIVTANEYYGTFKGTVDPVVAANRIQQGNTKAEVIDTNGDGHFKVTTEGTERLRINSVGNLLAGGITTSLSGFMFGSSTFGGEDGEMYLYKSAANAASLRITIDGPYVEFKDEDGDVQMGSAGSDLRLSANGDEKVRITSTGNVGIGTTRPFDSYGTASGGTGFEKRLEVVSGGAIPYLFSGGDFVDAEDVLSVTTKSDYGGFNINVRNQNEDNPLWTIRTFANEPIAFGQGLFEIARFDGNGNLGIGTTNPELPVTSGNTAKLAVGIVTAHELYGTLKGAIDPGVAITKANKINIQTNAENATKYLTFVSDTSGYEDVLVNTNITYNPNFEGRNIGKLTINGDVGIAGTLTVEDVTNVDSIGLITARTGVRITQDGLVVTAGVSTFGDHLIPSATDSYNIGEDPNVAGNKRWNKVYAAEYYGTFKGTIDPSVSDSKIKQGDTKAEVLDTGTDGRFVVTTDNVERLKINHTGLVQIGDRHNASTYNWDARLKVAIEQNTDSNGDQVNDPSAIHFGESVNNSANPAINFLRRDGATTWSAHVGQIHYGLDTDGNQAQMVFATALNNTPGNHSIQPRMFIKQTGYVGIATENIDDPIGTQNNTKLAVAGIVTALEYYGLFKGTIDTTVNSISLNTNLQDVFSVSGNQLSAKDVNADRIIFWDDNPGELTHLAVDSNTLEIDGTTLKVKASAVGKTYTLDAVDSGDNAILRLSDGTNNDDVTITAGTGITLDPVATGGFTIAANANAGKTYTLDAVDSGDNAILRLSDGTNNDDVTITAGSNITINPVAAGGFTIAAVQGAGLDLDSSVADVLDITSGTLSADDPDDDKIIFYDDSATKLTHLTVGTGLVINDTTLNIDNSVVGKSYTLPASGTDGSGGASGGSGSATLTLTGTDSTTDPVTVTAGSGIVIDNTTESGFRISADISEGGGGGLSDVQVKQFADNASPRTLRVSSLGDPIEVQKSVGIVTIGIGTTSNAYGNRFIQPSTPTGAVEGDIWFDTSTTGSGVNRVALLEDRKNNGVNGGNVGTTNIWFTRTLNHKTDPQSFIISFTGSVFVLEPGTYKIKFSAPGFWCKHYQSRITYSTAADFSVSPSYLQGSSEFSGGTTTVGENIQSRSRGEGVITLTDTTYFKLEQNVSYQQGVSDSNNVNYTTLGVPASRGGGEVYSQVLIEDLATAIKLENPNRIFQGDSKAEIIDTGSNGHFLVETDGAERLRITSTGQLNLAGNMQFTVENPELEFNNGGPRFRVPEANTLAIHNGGGLGSTDNEAVRITQEGNVGIGTTNPTADNIEASLDTNTKVLAVGIVTANEYYGTFKGDIGADVTISTDKISEGNTEAEVVDSGSDGHFKVKTDGAERFRINEYGVNVVGVTTTTKLAVTGVSTFKDDVEFHGISGISSIAFDKLDNSLKFIDNAKLKLGQSGDLEIYHGQSPNNPGSADQHSYIRDTGTGDLVLLSNQVAIRNTAETEDMARFYSDGQVELRYDNTLRFETTNDGVKISGGLRDKDGQLGSSGQVLSSTGSELNWIDAASGGGNVATSIKTFTTSGSHTYTPTSGTTSIVVHVIGAGGGSGTPKYYAWSGGGGAGGVAVKTYSVGEFGTSAAIQVGAKGTAGTANNTNNAQNGGTGGSSSFNPNGSGVTITAYGGVGSGAVVGQGNYTEGGDGGAAANGDLNYTGEKGYVFVDRTVDDNGAWTNYNGIVPDWRYHSGSTKARYHLYRAQPAAGGYGSYGLGGEATTTTESSVYNNGREGNDGAVIIYEYAGSGGSGSGGGSSFVLLSEQTATGASVEFTGIPSDAQEITVMVNGVSGSGTDNMLVQLGTSGGYITSGYSSSSEAETGGNSVSSSDGFIIFSNNAGYVLHGSMIVNKASSNSYTEIGQFKRLSTSACQTYGSLSSVSGTVDRLKIKFTGSDTFDAGTVSVSYKTSGVASAGTTKVAVLQDVRTEATNGGTATAANWHGRRLNTKLDPTNFVTLLNGSTGIDGTANTFSLEAGTYLLQWRAPGFDAGKMIAKMAYTTSTNYNTLFNSQSSTGVNYLSGETAQTSSGISATSSTASGDLYATGSATITITQTTYFRLQHYVSAVATFAPQTLGRNNDITGEDEIYSQVIVQDLATAVKSGVNASDKIEQGDTSAEVIDTGTDGRFIVKTNNTERLRIKGDTSNTFANSDDIIINGGGGVASAGAAVTSVINMGTSYFDTGTGLDHRNGSGDWRALKLYLYKNPTGTNAQTIDNVYGFGVSNGVMEIQTNSDLGFFVGSAGAGSGKRTERMRILSTGQINVGGTIATNLQQTTYTMYVLGSFGATSIAASSKSFVIDHPTKENHTLRHGCLEGPEHAVYVRGKTSGSVINLPDYWVGLVHEDSITVNLTPIGNKRVWVESINNNIVTTGSDDSTEYFYTIFGERKDIDKIVVEEEK